MIDNYRMLIATQKWLTAPFDPETQYQVRLLLDGPIQELHTRFGTRLQIGPSGFFGKLGIGDSRINRYSLGIVAQAICNYLQQENPITRQKIVIGYEDQSVNENLALSIADICTANGFKVSFFHKPRTSAELAFAVHFYNAKCGLMVTTKDVSTDGIGLKIIDTDGGLLGEVKSQIIQNIVETLNYSDIKYDSNNGLLDFVHLDIDTAYQNFCLMHSDFNVDRYTKDAIRIGMICTSNNHTLFLKNTLFQSGYKNITISNVNSFDLNEVNNFENNLSVFSNSELIFKLSENLDHLSLYIKDSNDVWFQLSENQTLLLLYNFLLTQWQIEGEIDSETAVILSCVASPVLELLSQRYGVKCIITNVGFKWVAEVIRKNRNTKIVCSGGPFQGFVTGDKYLENDVVLTTLLLAEIATFYKSQGSSLNHVLGSIYNLLPFYAEARVNITDLIYNNNLSIENYFEQLASNPPTSLAREQVLTDSDSKFLFHGSLNDFMSFGDIDLINVKIFRTNNGSKICIYRSDSEVFLCVYQKISIPLSASNYFEVANVAEPFLNHILFDLNLSKRD